jgi:hypothetical protein
MGDGPKTVGGINMAEEIKNEQPEGVEPQDNKPEDKKEPEKKEEKTFTQAELEEILEKRLARERKKLERFADYDELKKKLEEYEKQAEEKRLAELSEAERLQEELKKLQAERESLAAELEKATQRMKEQAILNEFIQHANKAGITYVEDAYKLADLSAVEFDENGKPLGIEEIVKNLVKEKPFLVAEKKAPRTIGESQAPTDRPEKTKEQRLKEAAEKARQSGKIEDFIKYVALKRELGL